MQIINLNVIRHTDDYAPMRAFYAEALGLPVRATWDDGPLNRGTVFALTDGGTIEVLQLGDVAQPPAVPVNLELVIQIDDVHAWHAALQARGVVIARGVEEQPWGHRSFGVDDPGGLRLWFVQHLHAG